MEDEEALRRCFDHFYTVQPNRTPGQTIGLTFLNIKTTNSFAWAADDNISGPLNFSTNVYKWDDARHYELAALTNTESGDRGANMAFMFYCLGHVLHLNQDTSSPDHVRNVAHPFDSYFEEYGQFNCTNHPEWFANQPHGWAYWQDRGFLQLLDFWDRNLYKGTVQSLVNNEDPNQPSKELGLAEFDNGNFLGDRSFYGECYDNHNNKHYFPFPSLADTDHKNLNPNNLEGSIIKDELINLKQGNRVYIKKTGAGVSVTPHSALTYEAVKNNLGRNIPKQVAFTINDANVLQEYHSILIPKAIEYSAGILDYFFRGTMDVTASWGDTNSLYFTNTVLNTSGQDFHGGTFFLFQDATDGTRTLVLHTNLTDILTSLNGILTNGTSVDILCPGPVPSTNRFFLVYQGTIGWTNNAALDLVDSNICIAAARPWYVQTKTYDYHPYLSDIGLTSGATITSILESDEFPFPLVSGNYEAVINDAVFDDTGRIGSVNAKLPNTKWPCDDLLNEITNTIVPASDISVSPDGKSLRVAISVTDEAKCGGGIGWMDVIRRNPRPIRWQAFMSLICKISIPIKQLWMITKTIFKHFHLKKEKRAGLIFFFENETGQHAVQIRIGINGTSWEHILIYDKDNKRIKAIKYISGRYAS